MDLLQGSVKLHWFNTLKLFIALTLGSFPSENLARERESPNISTATGEHIKHKSRRITMSMDGRSPWAATKLL